VFLSDSDTPNAVAMAAIPGMRRSRSLAESCASDTREELKRARPGACHSNQPRHQNQIDSSNLDGAVMLLGSMVRWGAMSGWT